MRWLHPALAGIAGIFLLTAGLASRRLPVAAPIIVEEAFAYGSDTLRSGEALGTLLVRRGVAPAEVAQVVRATPHLQPRRLRAGHVFQFQYPLGDSAPLAISTRVDDHRIVRYARADSGQWNAAVDSIFWQVEQFRLAGAVSGSLYDAFHRGIPDSILPRGERDRFLADVADGIYGWEIDFSRDLSEGDEFQIVYERLVSSLGDVRYGRVLAARVESRGIPNRAYVMTDPRGANAYYDERGISLRRAFRRNPVAYLRISSSFARRRLHPVLGTWRAHRGIDYSARTGTEIWATGDGVVRLAGRNGGYGLMVILRHPRGIETRYAHMSRLGRGIVPGARVQQGQVIGYVGASGLANGPHVHYEFLKNGAHQNPKAVDLGDGSPLPPGRMAELEAVMRRYDAILEQDSPPQQIARR